MKWWEKAVLAVAALMTLGALAAGMTDRELWRWVGNILLIGWGAAEAFGYWLKGLDWKFLFLVYITCSIYNGIGRIEAELRKLEREIAALRPFEFPKNKDY